MSEHPVADLRTARTNAAGMAAARQYRMAARRLIAAASGLMLDGWFGWAGETLRMVDRLELAAAAEERT